MTIPSPFEDHTEDRNAHNHRITHIYPSPSYASYQPNQKDDEIDLTLIWASVRKVLPGILGISLLLGTLAYGYLRTLPMMYQSSASLITVSRSSLQGMAGLVDATPLPQGVLREALQSNVVINDVLKKIKASSTIPVNQKEKLISQLQTELRNRAFKTVDLSSRLDINNNGIYTVYAKAYSPEASAHLADIVLEGLLTWDRNRALSSIRRAQRSFKAQLAEIDRQLKTPLSTISTIEKHTLIAARSDVERNLAQANIQAQGVSGALEMISPAITPLYPVAPKPIRNSVLVTVLVALLGMGLAILRAMLDRSVKSEEELLQFGLPLLGNIPRIHKRNIAIHGIIKSGNQSGIYEAIGFLKINLSTNLSKDQKIVMITSTYPGEGKSSLTLTLADGMASDGKRVLIIDADMRRGSQRELWSKYSPQQKWVPLTGKGSAHNLQSALKDPRNVRVIEAESGVHLLPSGSGIQDSLGLLNRPDLHNIIREWGKGYDLVIIDSPPLLALADGLTVGKVADAVIMIAEEGKTSMQALKKSLRRATENDINIIGFVLNKIDTNRTGNGYIYNYDHKNTDSLARKGIKKGKGISR